MPTIAPSLRWLICERRVSFSRRMRLAVGCNVLTLAQRDQSRGRDSIRSCDRHSSGCARCLRVVPPPRSAAAAITVNERTRADEASKWMELARNTRLRARGHKPHILSTKTAERARSGCHNNDERYPNRCVEPSRNQSLCNSPIRDRRDT